VTRVFLSSFVVWFFVRRLVFDSRAVYVGYLVDIVEMGQVFFPARLQLSPVGIVPPMRHTRIDSCTFDAIQPWILTEIKVLPATGTLSFVKEREDVKLPYRPVSVETNLDNTSVVISCI
jgi:hypothetical protein